MKSQIQQLVTNVPKSCIIEEQADTHHFSLLRWSCGFRVWSTLWASWENSAALLQTTHFFDRLLAGFSAGQLCAEGSCGHGLSFMKKLLPSLFESSSNTCWVWPGLWGLHSMFLLRLYIFPVDLLMWLALASYSLFKHAITPAPSLDSPGQEAPQQPKATLAPSSDHWKLWKGLLWAEDTIAQRSMCPMDLPRFGRDTWAGRIRPWTTSPSVLSCNDLDKCPPGNWWHKPLQWLLWHSP